MNQNPNLFRRPLLAGLLFAVAILMFSLAAQAATVTTDKLDYPPFSDVYIDGAGFQSGEVVTVHIAEINADGSRTPVWDANPSPIADANGAFTVVWFIFSEDFLGATLEVTATGLTSGFVATAQFTDGNIKFETTGLPAGTSVTVNFTYDQSGSAPVISTSTTFNSPGPSSNFAAENNTVVTYSFPASITVGPTTYVLTSSSPASGSNIGNGATTFTANYAACTPPSINCPANVSVDCSASTDPSNTGTASATGTGVTPPHLYRLDRCGQLRGQPRHYSHLDGDRHLRHGHLRADHHGDRYHRPDHQLPGQRER